MNTDRIVNQIVTLDKKINEHFDTDTLDVAARALLSARLENLDAHGEDLVEAAGGLTDAAEKIAFSLSEGLAQIAKSIDGLAYAITRHTDSQ